ncbi:hypothetical protein CAEBREN_00960 [Caenorhabditis brenneri]|uniref:Domain of unknown function WSN domain-containing protein n=1 Tax=Caenorhabditis brenneri TaxID=135651 RepID=G0MDI2_CAEBE|nr:hypothetical protein CAEBREN_00960 [Caenorhabditis brenneri]
MKNWSAVLALIFIECRVFGYTLHNQTYLTPLEHFMVSKINLKIEDDMEEIDQALEITNSILEIGGAIEPLGLIFEPLAALGNLVATLFKLRPQTDPVMEMLKKIEGQISKLGDQMRQQFEELKAYITEESFSADIVQTASTLHRFMQDTIKYPGNDSITVFYQEYQKNRPISVGYVYIETFTSGMFKNKSMYEFNRLVDGLKEVKQINEAWKVAFAVFTKKVVGNYKKKKFRMPTGRLPYNN